MRHHCGPVCSQRRSFAQAAAARDLERAHVWRTAHQRCLDSSPTITFPARSSGALPGASTGANIVWPSSTRPRADSRCVPPSCPIPMTNIVPFFPPGALPFRLRPPHGLFCCKNRGKGNAQRYLRPWFFVLFFLCLFLSIHKAGQANRKASVRCCP